MRQRKSEWFEFTKEYTHYQERQFVNANRSTVHFCEFLEDRKVINTNSAFNIIDIGAGQGANIFYMSRRFPSCRFVGVDFNPDLIKKGNRFFTKNKVANCVLKVGDLYKLSKTYNHKFDGLVSYQTISWLPDYKVPLENMMALRPKWIALSSLFYEGEVSAEIQIKDYTVPLKTQPYTQRYYNVYSLPLVKELFKRHGFKRFSFAPFEIDIDLSKPKSGGMGTYTEKLASGERIQISGPLMLNWYFILASR
jgi:ubiquinone/menaquinone biosynthesis C-methylase UbiE